MKDIKKNYRETMFINRRTQYHKKFSSNESIDSVQ